MILMTVKSCIPPNPSIRGLSLISALGGGEGERGEGERGERDRGEGEGKGEGFSKITWKVLQTLPNSPL